MVGYEASLDIQHLHMYLVKDSLTTSIGGTNNATHHRARVSAVEPDRTQVAQAGIITRDTGPGAPSTDNATISFLPNTIQETRASVAADSQPAAERSRMEVENQAVECHLPGVETVGEDDRTQQLPESVLEEFRSRTTSREQLRQQASDRDDQEDDEAGHGATLDEGDSGHIDLASSFVLDPLEQDSAPIEFSPSQSQQPLTQFPESQRFKTPATAGRKRDHAGNFVETPAVSRNPFARNGQETASLAVALSQAFAQTQAASSPLLHAPTSVLRSDRPSPGLQIEQTIVQPPTSSPSRPISEIKRAATEPASRYVPLDHSQRIRNGRIREWDNESTQATDSDFDMGEGVWRQEKRRRDREAVAIEQLKAASSPISGERHDILSTARRAESERPPTHRNDSSKSWPSSPPLLGAVEKVDEDDDVAHQENEEVESFVEADVVIPETSRPKRVNLVPDTVKRSVQELQPSLLTTQPSPSARQLSRRDTRDTVWILNSQKSALSTQEPLVTQPVRSTADSVEMVPASPEGELVATQPSNSAKRQNSGSEDSETGVQGRKNGRVSSPVAHGGAGHFVSKIPETSFGRNGPDQQQDTSAPFSTAPEFSSQPVLPPPGRARRRRRLGDISQEDMVSRASQQSVFDHRATLGLGGNPELASSITSERAEHAPPVRKRVKITSFKPIPQLEVAETRSLSADEEAVGKHDDAGLGSDNADVENEEIEPAVSDGMGHPVVRQDTRTRRTRHSRWEIPDSPEQTRIAHPLDHRKKPVSQMLLQVTAKPHRKSAGGSQSTPFVQASIEDVSPDPLAMSPSSRATSAFESMPEIITAHDMVFAYYMGRTRAYYPAKCLGVSEDGEQYTIKWPGYDVEVLAKHMVSSLDLRIGDEVKVDRDDFPKIPFKICGFSKSTPAGNDDALTDIYGHRSVVLEPKNVKGKLPKNFQAGSPVAISNIYIALNMWKRVNQRNSAYTAAQTNARLSGIATPPIRSSTPTTPSSRNRILKKETVLEPNPQEGVFSNMAFALSFEDASTRRDMKDLVAGNGGTILEYSFQELLTDDLQLKAQFRDMGFSALLADRHSRKLKYLEALALGLPCLSGKWVEACIKSAQVAEWQDYLLPAGESVELGGAVRSRTMPLTYHEVANSLATVVAERPQQFQHCSAVFITGKGKVAEKRSSYLFLAQAMGVVEMHKVTDFQGAKAKLLEMDKQNQIWLFVDEKDREQAVSTVQQLGSDAGNKSSRGQKRTSNGEIIDNGLKCRIADSEFVVQSLILGRLLSHE